MTNPTECGIINIVKRIETPRSQVMANLCDLPKPQKNKKKSKALLTNHKKCGIINIVKRERHPRVASRNQCGHKGKQKLSP